MPFSQAYQDRRKALAQVAKETKAMTPDIASSLAHLEPTVSDRLDLGTLPPLDPTKCPRFKLDDACGTLIRVVGLDSFDAAISMPTDILGAPSDSLKSMPKIESARLNQLKKTALSPDNLSGTAARVAVLNMASEKNPGGGWLGGAAAQEEALCFRSTLAASLVRTWYPIPARSGLYTRDVVIFRTSMGDGHELMVPDTPADQLPVVSVLSVAGIRRPAVKAAGDDLTDRNRGIEKRGLVFADPDDRDLTKDKMRLCLRMAAANGHTMIVLGALGCGAFRNPPEEVAACWQEVLDEAEFAGGWFKEIWFAVYDRKNDGNLPVFQRDLDGRKVGLVSVTEI